MSAVTATSLPDLYPEWFAEGEDRFFGPSDYTPLLREFGDIILRVDERGYSGDTFLLYVKENWPVSTKFGFLAVGWGSCSGCDALQGANTVEKILELAGQLESSIHWAQDKATLLKWLNSDHQDFEWYQEKREFEAFRAAARILLARGDADA